jgi:hypothetical protein
MQLFKVRPIENISTIIYPTLIFFLLKKQSKSYINGI